MKGSKPKKLQLVKENQKKISSFFTRINKNENTPTTSWLKKRKIEETNSESCNGNKKSKEELDLQSIKIEDDDFEVSCLTVGLNKPLSSKNTVNTFHVTPEKKRLNITPTKRSPKTNRTPSKSSKITPTKNLFNKSPRHLEEFNVQIINNFVKITPSKSNKKIVITRNKFTSPEKTSQSSLLEYVSPSANKSLVKSQNESTPTKETPSEVFCSPRSLKVKTKLNFGESLPSRDIENAPCCSKTVNGVINHEKEQEIAFNGDDSWDNQISAITDTLYNLNLSKSQHCKVLEVQKLPNTLKLLLQSTKTQEKALCHLTDFWSHLKIQIGDTLHVSAKEGSSGWLVSNNEGLVVLNPDFLISSTSVVASVFCKRRSVLTERYRGFDPSNRHMVVGSLVHKLLQDSLQCRANSEVLISRCLKKILEARDTAQMLYASSLSIEDIETELKSFVLRIHTFIQQYVTGTSKEKEKENWQGTIDSIEDIEENFWCPELGIKGKVDISVRSGDTAIPVELKTGRATVSLEHRGQVILYLMMMQKFGYKIDSGLLLYLREGVLKEIQLSHREKRDITILRNELAYYLTGYKSALKTNTAIEDLFNKSTASGFLPKPIDHHVACGNCPYNTICSVYLKTENFDLSKYKHLEQIQSERLQHLKQSHIEYFIHWSGLLTLETAERRDVKELQEIFTIPANVRQKNGRCITDVSLTSVEFCNGLYYSTFERLCDERLNFMTSGIGEGNYVVVSTDSRPAVAAGFVMNMDDKSVVVTVERDLKTKYPTATFHIDTYDSNSTNLINMSNLSLLLEDTERAARLRDLIIDKTAPRFRDKLPRNIAKVGTPILRQLNKVQQRAVLRAVAADDYLLIKGMPGTGKTSTIVALIQLLVELGKSVLITSHTNSAVDNVCLRLLKYGMKPLRLGSSKKIHRELASICEEEVTKHCKTPNDFENVYEKAKVVAVTCLGSGHPLLSKRVFDICVVDESTQVLQPSLFRTLFAAEKFVLIGDPDQLSPLVRNQKAIKMGMSESIFERLQTANSNVTLNLNYRMNKPITDLANALTYNGELLTADDKVASSRLNLPEFNEMLSVYRNISWILEALDESLASSVKVLDTGPIWNLKLNNSLINRLKMTVTPSGEEKHGEILSCSNPYETVIVAVVVRALLKAEVPPDSIGIIAPYRAQVAQIESVLQETNIEISTIDRFQGRDKNVIIFSATKSFNCKERKCDDENKYEILNNTQRINVAITRAKQKLIIIGDRESLNVYKPFCKIFASLDESCFVKVVQKPEDYSEIISLFENV